MKTYLLPKYLKTMDGDIEITKLEQKEHEFISFVMNGNRFTIFTQKMTLFVNRHKYEGQIAENFYNKIKENIYIGEKVISI